MDVGRIVVAGAGAVGSTIACVLAHAGHAVTVVDPAPLGANASGVAAGMLAPAFETLFDEASASRHGLFAEARDLWPALARTIGLELARDGALAIGHEAEARAWAASLAARGVEAQLLTPDEATRIAAGLPANAWAVFAPGDWRLDPMPALAALRRAAEGAGARFVAGRVLGFDGRAVEIEGATPLAADSLVIATGAAMGLTTLAPELTALTPIKGHILRAPGEAVDQPVIRAPGVYVCRAAGEVIVGATMEPGRSDTAIDAEAVHRLIEAAAPLTASLGPLDWRASAGVRAATPDGLPLVGRSRTPGVILAVGARRNGWLLAPLIAETVRAAVEGSAFAAVAIFDPARAGGMGGGGVRASPQTPKP